MGLLDVINGMQQGPRGPSTSTNTQSGGGMSPMTMDPWPARLEGLQAFHWEPARCDGRAESGADIGAAHCTIG